ncbi:MAG: hypothetical protein ACI92E_002211 [Oceanicoccus sp.]|jgi:uncharacterized iron-regulated membrane protein
MGVMTKTRVNYWVRKSHRWISLIIGVQLLLWTISGLYFSLVPMATVRGEDNIRKVEPVNFAQTTLISPTLAIDKLIEETGLATKVRAVKLRQVLGAPAYEIHFATSGPTKIRLASAITGDLLPALNKEQAMEAAETDFSQPAEISSVEYITFVNPGSEYRNRPLPAWQVSFGDKNNTRIYVSSELAKVTARRNDSWRYFDFLWMLHIMDLEDREDFNTFLLQALSAIAIFTILSGFILWALTTSLFRRLQTK